MCDSNKERCTKEKIEVGGIYWHPGYAQLVRVSSLGVRFEGVAAEFEFVDVDFAERGSRWCFCDVLRNRNQIQSEMLELLANFQANQMARNAFAKLEG